MNKWLMTVAAAAIVVSLTMIAPSSSDEDTVMAPIMSPEMLPLAEGVADGQEEFTLMVTGDVMLGRVVNAQTVNRGDFTWPFEKIAGVLSAADITLVNLESPLMRSCPVVVTGMKFCGDARHTEGLLVAGVDVVGFANNHSDNYGEMGVKETYEMLREAGIAVAGAEAAWLEAAGNRVAVLAFNDVGGTAKGESVAQAVKAARQTADVVVVLMHWGNEYTHIPIDRQRSLARVAVDAGADLVTGNHPHWVQATEKYKGKLIAYSHGNLVFDQNWSRKTSEGVIGRYVFKGGELTSHSFIPVVIENNAQPRLADAEESEKIIKDIETASAALDELE